MPITPGEARAIHEAEQHIAATDEAYVEFLRPFFIGYFQAKERGLGHQESMDIGKVFMGQVVQSAIDVTRAEEKERDQG